MVKHGSPKGGKQAGKQNGKRLSKQAKPSGKRRPQERQRRPAKHSLKKTSAKRREQKVADFAETKSNELVIEGQLENTVEEHSESEEHLPEHTGEAEDVGGGVATAMAEEAEEDEEDYTQTLADDPYLLAERKDEMTDPSSRWTNRQRTLLFASRGINLSHRHLMEDLKKLMPHHKTESKWDKSNLDDIPEAAEMANCNNICYFEARKRQDLYMYLARMPNGPTIKFGVLNAHNSGEMNFLGNNLMYSRPLLVFDAHFNELAPLKLMREMFVQMWGTPRNHPKAKPFHDHVLSFHWLNDKIWIRHFQIFNEKFNNKVDEQTLIEIGPRCALDPIRVQDGIFGGRVVWKNPEYVSPTARRVMLRRMKGTKQKEDPATKRFKTEAFKVNKMAKAKPMLENLFARA